MDLNYVRSVLINCQGKNSEFITYQNGKLLKDIDVYMEQAEFESNVYNKISTIEKFKVEHSILKNEMKFILREGNRETERKKIEEILFNLGSALTYLTDILNNSEVNKYNPRDFTLTEDRQKKITIVDQMKDTKIALEREKMDYISSLAALKEEVSRERQLAVVEELKLKIELENARKII